MIAADDFGSPPTGSVSKFTMAMNYVPLLYVLAGGFLLWSVEGWPARTIAAVAWIYLVPPVVCRMVLLACGRPETRGARQDAGAYKVWWFLAQLQVVYNRVPVIEEVLRLIPGMYATWLNLWGASVSPFAYWGPGAQILDRYLVRVGARAVIGTRVLMSGHLGSIDADGEFVVDIAPVDIGEGALVGAMSGLAPGSRVGPGEAVPTGRFLSPFGVWEGGRRVRQASS